LIPSLAALLQGYAFFTRANGLDPDHDEARLAAALSEAAELAAGHPEDEPAALLFALTKGSRALPEGWDYPVICATNLARMRGEVLVVSEPWVLDDLRLRVVTGSAQFDEVRAWIAERVRARS
jgi:hypothetical protein